MQAENVALVCFLKELGVLEKKLKDSKDLGRKTFKFCLLPIL